MTAVATEPVPIHFKLTLQRRKTEGERAEAFRDLAQSSDTPDDAAECAVRAWAHRSLLEGDGSAAWAAFCEYRNALLTADGIETGAIPWREYAPYTCRDRKEQAWWDALGEVDGHMRVLLGGHGAPRHIHTSQKAGA
jgi:hypothetical protein